MIRTLVFAFIVGLAPQIASGQEWPTKPLRFVIGSGPGGLMETVLSATSPVVEARLGQRIILEYRPGAGGNIGAQAVLAAPADGYTFMPAASTIIVTNPFFYGNMPFDPLRDLVPVTMLVDNPLVIAVSAKLPVRTIAELAAHLASNPGRVHYGSPGNGTPPHLAGELMTRALGVNAVHVPYKGAAAAATALIANEVQFFIIAYASLRGQIQGGLARPLAVAGESRLAAMPHVPTLSESGYPQVDAAIGRFWWGLFAARGTPEPIIARVAAEYRAALMLNEVQARLREAGLIAVGNTPAEFAAMLPPQAAKWQALSKTLNIKFD